MRADDWLNNELSKEVPETEGLYVIGTCDKCNFVLDGNVRGCSNRDSILYDEGLLENDTCILWEKKNK